MLPAPEKSALHDAHVSVADPDLAQHPEDLQPLDRLAAADASSASTAQSEGAQYEGRAEEDEQKEWQAQPILLDVQKECFSRLLLLPEILVDHLPDTYLAAVQQL